MSEYREPWRWVDHLNHGGEETNNDSNLGGFVDADGDPVCWFGDVESYYPTAGKEPSPSSSERIVACVNALSGVPTDEILDVVRLGIVVHAGKKHLQKIADDPKE